MLTNEPYDEAVDVSDPEEIPSLNSSPRGGHPSLQQQQQQLRERAGAPAGASARQTGSYTTTGPLKLDNVFLKSSRRIRET